MRPFELEDAQQRLGVPALGQIASVRLGHGERVQLLVGDVPLAMGGRLGRTDQEALATRLTGDPGLRVEERVERPDVEPVGRERELIGRPRQSLFSEGVGRR